MKPDASHIKQIKVVSNTHWDREWRESFEITRAMLIRMMDITLDLLEKDENYKSFTLDGQSIPLDDYLEIRPEKREQIEKFVKSGRIVAGPYYTLAEQFSISHEPLVRNFIKGRETVEKYGGKTGTVAYTPSSWGQTGQLPQILNDFGLSRMMFYRGISHHESDAEYIWQAPDGSRVMANRFAVYARYNWYYLVYRLLTRGTVSDREYFWGKFDEVPYRIADHHWANKQGFHIHKHNQKIDKDKVKEAIEGMLNLEGPHYATEVFIAMNGHDLSVPAPVETEIIKEAQKIFEGKYDIEHTSLEEYWNEMEKHLDKDKLTVLTGERRSYLKQGLWTTLMPDTITARINLKQIDHDVTMRLVHGAEPLSVISSLYGASYPVNYLDRAWTYLMSNHTHDSNGGCAPDEVCFDMQYRYKKVYDISNIVSSEAMIHIATNLDPKDMENDAIVLVAYNTLPFARSVVAPVDVDLPVGQNAEYLTISDENGENIATQKIQVKTDREFVDSIWDAPAYYNVTNINCFGEFKNIPATGYKTYTIKADKNEYRNKKTMITGPNSMENDFLKIEVNSNGSVNITNKETGKLYKDQNYITDRGECGNAWVTQKPTYDKIINSLGINASIAVEQSGELSSTITASMTLNVPREGIGEEKRSDELVGIPVKIFYTLERGSKLLKIKTTLENTARDHLIRVNFPTELNTDVTYADSHFDVVKRQIEVPDSTGWIEEARGTHPMRTFVDMTDGKHGLGLISKGIFEYEAYQDEKSTLALTLLRCLNVKQPIGPKPNELPDPGPQCLGLQEFEYALYPHASTWEDCGLLSIAQEFQVPVRFASAGRGKGTLPHSLSVFTMDNTNMQVTCVKQAEDGNGIIIRLFNPCESEQKVKFTFAQAIKSAKLCKMDENEIENLTASGTILDVNIKSKKISTFRINL